MNQATHSICLPTSKQSRAAGVFQTYNACHERAPLINTAKSLKELRGPIIKQSWLFVFFLKNKGEYTEVVKQITAAGPKGELSTASAQT